EEEVYSDLNPYKGSKAQTGILTAGEVHDFSKWALWEDIANETLKMYTMQWGTHPLERYTVQLTTEQGMPLIDAEVRLMNRDARLWTARTDNTGKAELWANAFTSDSVKKGSKGFSVVVKYRGESYRIEDVTKFQDGVNALKIPVQCEVPDTIDLAFV